MASNPFQVMLNQLNAKQARIQKKIQDISAEMCALAQAREKLLVSETEVVEAIVQLESALETANALLQDEQVFPLATKEVEETSAKDISDDSKELGKLEKPVQDADHAPIKNARKKQGASGVALRALRTAFQSPTIPESLSDLLHAVYGEDVENAGINRIDPMIGRMSKMRLLDDINLDDSTFKKQLENALNVLESVQEQDLEEYGPAFHELYALYNQADPVALASARKRWGI